MRSSLPLFLLLLASRYAGAQATTDGSVGPLVRLGEADFVVDENLGARRGNNLFHSFESFSVPDGGSATFTGAADIRNVITRITGGEGSTIEGTLRSEIGSEGFFFLNPSGIVISGGAVIEVPGAFHVSDAESIEFEDGAVLFSGNASTSGLTVASPSAFGFLGSGGGVTIDGATLEFGLGQSLDVTGSSVRISGSSIQLDGGGARLQGAKDQSLSATDLADVAGAGGLVRLSETTVLATGGDVAAGGEIVRLNEYSRFGTLATETQDAGSITVRGDTLSIRNVSDLYSRTESARDAGDVLVDSSNLKLNNGEILAETYGDGDAGDITIRGGQLDLVLFSVLTSSVGAGNGGEILIESDEMNLRFGLIASSAIDEGDAGVVTVNANKLEIYGGGIFSETSGEGNAASIFIRSDDLSMGYGFINASTLGSGQAASITIDAARLTLQDSYVNSGAYGGRASDGDAADITITGETLLLTNGYISSSSDSTDAGALQITMGDLVQLTNASLSTAVYSNTGGGGSLDVNAPFLVVGSSGVMQTTAVLGNGGPITLDVNALVAAPGARIDADSQIGADGQIAISGQQLLNTTETAALDSGFLDAGAILSNPCLAALLGRSELVLTADGLAAQQLSADAPTSLLLSVVSDDQAETSFNAFGTGHCQETE